MKLEIVFNTLTLIALVLIVVISFWNWRENKIDLNDCWDNSLKIAQQARNFQMKYENLKWKYCQKECELVWDLLERIKCEEQCKLEL